MEEARGAGEEGELRCGTQVSGWSKRVNLVSCRRQEVEGQGRHLGMEIKIFVSNMLNLRSL